MKNILNGKVLFATVLITVVLVGHVILIGLFFSKDKTTVKKEGSANNDSSSLNTTSGDSNATSIDPPVVEPVVNNNTMKKDVDIEPAVVPVSGTSSNDDSLVDSSGDITIAPTTSRSKNLVMPGTISSENKDKQKNKVVVGDKKQQNKKVVDEPKSQDRVVVRTIKLMSNYPTNSLQKRFPETNPGVNFDYSGAISNFAGSKSVRAGILVDLETRKVLWSKNSDKAYGIASMTKMMTALLAMEKLAQDSSKKFTSIVKVSKTAAKFSAKQRSGIIWLDHRESFSIDNLLKAMLIKSANDVAYLVAEYFGGGDESKFIVEMNKRSKELGFDKSSYINSHGLTEYRSRRAIYNKSSAEDQARLAELLLQYPKIVEIASMTSFKLPRKVGKNKYTLLTNTNKLISKKNGIIGMKTGFTNVAGSCLTAVYHKNNKTLVAVVVGMPSSKSRNIFVGNLLEWGAKKVAKK